MIQATPAVGQNGLVSIHLLGLQSGATAFCYLQVTVDPNLTGSFSNTATVTGPLGDTDPSNNTSTAITQILEPPQITCPGNILLNAEPGKCAMQWCHSLAKMKLLLQELRTLLRTLFFLKMVANQVREFLAQFIFLLVSIQLILQQPMMQEAQVAALQ